MISLAMTTYNGGKYLYQQLESLYCQTRKIDEVIICDDGSTDGTPDIVRAFIRERQPEGWSFQINAQKKGFVDNFINAAGQTSGDIVFFCDQDDIWAADKVRDMTAVMEERPEIQVLSCEVTCVDAEGNPLPGLRINKGDASLERISVEKFCVNPAFPGMSMAVRREMIPLLRDLNKHCYLPGHDWALNILAAAQGALYLYHKELVFYRLHGNNTIGIKRNKSRESPVYRLKEISSLYNHYQYALSALLVINRKENNLVSDIRMIKSRISYLEQRHYNIEYRKRIRGALMIRYLRYYPSLKVYIGDMLYILNLAKFFK